MNTSVKTIKVYDEIVDFIAAGTTPESVINFHLSETAQNRRDFWGDHFQLNEAIIQPLTDIGEVKSRILDFNKNERIIERQLLIEVDKYPPRAAKEKMSK